LDWNRQLGQGDGDEDHHRPPFRYTGVEAQGQPTGVPGGGHARTSWGDEAVIREADVVLAVDVNDPRRQKIVKGKAALRRTARSESSALLKVFRVELDLDTDEYEWLETVIAYTRRAR